jgi:ubiquitin-conjugating enzyme E2 J2
MPSPTKVCVKRLSKELRVLSKTPIPHLQARPLCENILEWHYVIYGLDGCYKDGIYHGVLKFPYDYPYKPPSLQMITPSGRFHTKQKLCLSFTDFHPESWNPMWSVSTILSGLVSFFTEESSQTYGSMSATQSQRLTFARRSSSFNLRDRVFCELFPDMVQVCKDNFLEKITSYANNINNKNLVRQRGVNDNNGKDDASLDNKPSGGVFNNNSNLRRIKNTIDGSDGSSGKFIESVFLVLFLICIFGVICILFYLQQRR